MSDDCRTGVGTDEVYDAYTSDPRCRKKNKERHKCLVRFGDESDGTRTVFGRVDRWPYAASTVTVSERDRRQTAFGRSIGQRGETSFVLIRKSDWSEPAHFPRVPLGVDRGRMLTNRQYLDFKGILRPLIPPKHEEPALSHSDGLATHYLLNN